jgi:superfamily II DNA or RNA helicase
MNLFANTIGQLQLRPYQQRIVEQTRIAFAKGNRRVLVYAPTGAGKTVIAKFIISRVIDQGYYALFTAHRQQLIEQTVGTMQEFCPSVVMGDDSRFNPTKLLQIGTLQTVTRRELIEPKLIIVDECHWGADMIEQLSQTYITSLIIGLSATPYQISHNNTYLLDGWDTVVNEIDTADLIEQGYLTPVRVFSPVSIDTSKITNFNSSGDFSAEEAYNVERPIIKNVVDEWIRLGENRKSVTYCCTIDHAEEMASAYRHNGIPALAIHSQLSKAERMFAMQEFASNNIKMLCNVDVLTTGWDDPTVSCIVLARPTRSLSLYLQIVGRGLRPHPHGEDLILLDCGSVVSELGFPTDKRKVKFRPVFSETIDRKLNIDTSETSASKTTLNLPPERQAYLERILSMLDLYSQKIYSREQDLVDDVRKFLRRANLFHWRQNSGKANIDGQWVNFTDKPGLPDFTLIYRGLYVGIECKMPHGRLTKHQKQTLPEMIDDGLLLFFATSVIDVFDAIEHLERYIRHIDNGLYISDEVFDLPEWQVEYRQKFKLPLTRQDLETV